MNPLFLYAIKVIVCSGILVGYYWLALRNKVFHHYNRFFLLSAVVLSLVIPVIKIDFWQQQQNKTPVIKLLQAVNADNNSLDEIVLNSTANAFDWQKFGGYLYLIFFGVLLIHFIVSLCNIFIIYKQSKKIVTNEISLIQTEAKGTPFSFFKLIFWNLHIDIHSTTGQQILQHEIAHIHQKHSYDKIFLNLVLIACWFNPFFWLIRKEINMIHEFTADRKAVKNCDSSTFAAMILQAAYPQHRFKLTNQFFYSPIKRRLMMLTKNTHTKAGYISRIMVLPLAAFVFVAFTFKAKTLVDNPYSGKKITVVIDAGHGGKDFGATDDNGIFEKDISLAIAQKIKALNTNNTINIILTRETDIYQSPPEKAEWVNEKKADLLISIHMDKIEKDNGNRQAGISLWVSRNEFKNSFKSKVLASSILQGFDKNFPLEVLQQPMQDNKGIWLLQASNCPSILIEAGFMSNKKDMAFLQTEKGKEAFAKNILNGIENYLNAKDNIESITALVAQDTLPQKVIPNEAIQIDDKIKGSLIVIDDKVSSSNKEALNKISPDNIESIVVLKGDEATKRFGLKGKNGVTIIYTKKYNYKEFDNDKQLVILNRKIIGNAKDVILELKKQDISLINNVNATINQISPKDAVKKYGKAAEYGASEVWYNYEKKNETTLKFKQTDTTINIDKNSSPLIVIDGKMMGNNSNVIKSISPDNIDRINILKDSSAVRLYGAKGVNGVIEIFTKETPKSSLKVENENPPTNRR